jgi:hypothetical protein
MRKKFSGRPEKKLIKKMREEYKEASNEEKHKWRKKNNEKRNKIKRT